MAAVVRLPSVLAGAEEAAIAGWLVSPGDAVTAGTPLAEIETEKAVVEYAAEEAGVVGRLVVPAGETAAVGDPIAVLISDGETDADIDAALGAAGPGAAAPAAAAVPAGADAARAGAPEAPAQAPAPARANGQAAARAPGGRIFASPLVRKLAHQRGLDLAAIAGTGPNGRIVRRDLERLDSGEQTPVSPSGAAGTPEPPASAAKPAPGAGRLIPHTPMRQAIARRLTQSKATVPHFYMAAECAVDELLALREQVNEAAPVRVSVNDFVIMAAAAAFGDVPEANVTWSDEGLIAHGGVDISLAVATDGGLVTPVLRDAGRKKLSEIAREAADLARRARDRRLRQHELEGGVLSVSNLGMYGTLEFSAIINPPQSGILAVGAARQQPVAAGGEVRVATVMRCTLSVDHRAIDGALAARWLAAFTARLEHPLSAIV